MGVAHSCTHSPRVSLDAPSVSPSFCHVLGRVKVYFEFSWLAVALQFCSSFIMDADMEAQLKEDWRRQRDVNKAIDAQLRAERKAQRNQVKLLLLGR
jgi:hypothetical protein